MAYSDHLAQKIVVDEDRICYFGTQGANNFVLVLNGIFFDQDIENDEVKDAECYPEKYRVSMGWSTVF